MKNDKLPLGLCDFSLTESEQREIITNKLFSVLKKGGFSKIEPSQIDLAKNLEMERNSSDTLFKSIDSDGRLLAFAGDITPSVMRIIEGSILPQRIYYDRPNYSFKPDNKGNRLKQECGAQIYGIKEAEGDAEAITIALDSLIFSGVKNVKITLSHAFLFRSIVYSYKPVEEITAEDIKLLIDTGKCDKVSDVCASAVSIIAQQKGNITVLQEVAESINNREAIDCLLRLFEIYQILAEYGLEEIIEFDFGYLPNTSYYNGMVFKISSGDIKMAEGGHFNGYKFSQAISGTGFKYSIDNIIKSTILQDNAIDDPNIVLGIANSIAALNKAYKIKMSLMESNVKISTMYKVSNSECKNYATRAGILNIVYINETGDIEDCR